MRIFLLVDNLEWIANSGHGGYHMIVRYTFKKKKKGAAPFDYISTLSIKCMAPVGPYLQY